ncbi:helix-turn-helix transcriptional regulator [Microbulbifer agarilyticus]
MKLVLFNAHDIVLFLTIYLCLLFALIATIGRRSYGWGNVWLGGFLLSQALMAFHILALWGEVFHGWVTGHVSWIFAVSELSMWLEGPLLLLYARSVLFTQGGFRRADWVLLAPFGLYLLFCLGALWQYTGESESPVLQFLRSDSVQFYEHFRNLVRAGFGVWALWTIKSYEPRLTDVYSNVDHLSFRWLKVLVVGFITLRLWSILYLTIYTGFNFVLGDGAIQKGDLDGVGIASNYGQLLLISGLLYYGFGVANGVHKVAHEVLEEVGRPNNEEERAPYTHEQVQRVSRYMTSARPYLNSNLKLEDLAAQVSVSPKLLSNLINREFECNFFEFVNRYRIAEVKQFLSDPGLKDQSVMDLAMRAGYNSKTTFNRLFKNDTGVTPTQFRKLDLPSEVLS